MNQFQTRFKLAIKAKGISRRELARLSGVHVNTLNNWAGGEVPNPHSAQIHKVVPFLGVSYLWLRTGEGPMRPASGAADRSTPYRDSFDPQLMEQVIRLTEDYARLYRRPFDEEQRVEVMEKAYQLCLQAGITGGQVITMTQFQDLVKSL